LRRYRWIDQQHAHGKTDNGTGGSQDANFGGRAVVFVNAISSVLRLTSLLAILLESPSADRVLGRLKMSMPKAQGEAPGSSVDVLGLQSKMRQKDRLKRIEKFRSSKHAILVCTDIAARGLDVPGIASVVHYQAPRGAEVFVHRSGRTARAGRSGESIAFMGPGDASHWHRVYRAVGITKEEIGNVGPTNFEINAAKEASHMAIELEKKLHSAAKKATDKSWMRHAADEAELMLDDDDDDPDNGKSAAPRHALWNLYKKLQARVRRPPKRHGAGPLPKHLRGR